MLAITKKLLMVAAIASIAISATGAYFSDTEVLDNNSFSSGTLDLVISEESTAPVTLENMKPGDSIEKVINITNNGSLDFGSLMLSLQNVTDDGGLLGGIDMSVSYASNTGTDTGTITDIGSFKASELGDKELIGDEATRLLAGNSGSITIVFSLSPDAGNEYQGLTANFDLAVNADQVR